MKINELLKAISDVDFENIIPKEYYTIVDYEGNFEDRKKNFMNRSKEHFFTIQSYNKAGLQTQLLYTVYAVICNISLYYMSVPNDEQMRKMLEISGYTVEEMQSYVKGHEELSLNSVASRLLVPMVMLLTRVTYEAMLNKKTWRKIEDTPEKEKLRNLVKFICDNGLMFLDQESTLDDYNKAVVKYAEFCLKRYYVTNEKKFLFDLQKRQLKKEVKKYEMRLAEVLIKNTSEGTYFRIPMSNAVSLEDIDEAILQDLTLDIFANADELNQHTKSVKKTYPADIKREIEQFVVRNKKWLDDSREALNGCDEIYDGIYDKQDEWSNSLGWPEIAQGVFAAILDGDNLYKTILGELFLNKLLIESTIPIQNLPMEELEDEAKWDYIFVDENGELAEKIYDENDCINVSLDIPSDDSKTVVHMKIGAFLSKMSQYVMEDSFYIRKSHYEMFRDLGISDQQSRDLSIILAVLENRRFLESCAYENCDMECHFPLAATAEDVENKKDYDIQMKDDISKVKKESDQKISALDKNLNLALKENKKYRHEINQLKKANEDLRRKLNELTKEENKSECMDIVDQKAGKEDQLDSIHYPYDADGLKLTLFGGFDIFHSELKKYIPDIRIVELAAHVDTVPIKNSDIVFMQTNKTNHSNYYMIRDTCKKSHVKFHHLSYSSPKRCAEEIVRVIENYKENKSFEKQRCGSSDESNIAPTYN